MESTALLTGAPRGVGNHAGIANGALDARAFEAIFETQYKRVYNFIAYRINNHGEVEELVSSTFEKVIAKYHTYQPSKAPIEAWVISIAKNVVNDYYRNNKKRTFLPLEFLTGAASDIGQPENIAVMSEEIAALLRALNSLSDRERTIVSMKFAAGLKHAEIARIMSLSESNVAIIIYRSMKKMRASMEGDSL